MRWTFWLAGILTLVAGYCDFWASPDDVLLGASQRIFYIHMGAATAVALAFTVTAGASVLYLATRQIRFDWIAVCSAEIGMVFTSMLLMTGMLWGRVVWGVWWTWDPRLTATLILWVLFMGYLILRDNWSTPERRARISAVLALVFYADVPLDYMTIRWWKSIHPIVITSHGIAMAPAMAIAMAVSAAAMVALYAAWMDLRLELRATEDQLEAVKNTMRQQIHGNMRGGIL